MICFCSLGYQGNMHKRYVRYDPPHDTGKTLEYSTAKFSPGFSPAADITRSGLFGNSLPASMAMVEGENSQFFTSLVMEDPGLFNKRYWAAPPPHSRGFKLGEIDNVNIELLNTSFWVKNHSHNSSKTVSGIRAGTGTKK